MNYSEDARHKAYGFFRPVIAVFLKYVKPLLDYGTQELFSTLFDFLHRRQASHKSVY